MSGIVEGADTLIGPGARVASPPVGPRVAFRFGGGVCAQGKPHDASGPPQNPLQGVQRAKPCRVNRLEDETSSVPTCSERAVCGVGGSCPDDKGGWPPLVARRAPPTLLEFCAGVLRDLPHSNSRPVRVDSRLTVYFLNLGM